jgi:hypothetical protein
VRSTAIVLGAVADTDNGGHDGRSRPHMADVPSVRDDRLARAVADRVAGRTMELFAIDERLNRLQERVDRLQERVEQARQAQPATLYSRPERSQP